MPPKIDINQFTGFITGTEDIFGGVHASARTFTQRTLRHSDKKPDGDHAISQGIFAELYEKHHSLIATARRWAPFIPVAIFAPLSPALLGMKLAGYDLSSTAAERDLRGENNVDFTVGDFDVDTVYRGPAGEADPKETYNGPVWMAAGAGADVNEPGEEEVRGAIAVISKTDFIGGDEWMVPLRKALETLRSAGYEDQVIKALSLLAAYSEAWGKADRDELKLFERLVAEIRRLKDSLDDPQLRTLAMAAYGIDSKHTKYIDELISAAGSKFHEYKKAFPRESKGLDRKEVVRKAVLGMAGSFNVHSTLVKSVERAVGQVFAGKMSDDSDVTSFVNIYFGGPDLSAVFSPEKTFLAAGKVAEKWQRYVLMDLIRSLDSYNDFATAVHFIDAKNSRLRLAITAVRTYAGKFVPEDRRINDAEMAERTADYLMLVDAEKIKSGRQKRASKFDEIDVVEVLRPVVTDDRLLEGYDIKTAEAIRAIGIGVFFGRIKPSMESLHLPQVFAGAMALYLSTQTEAKRNEWIGMKTPYRHRISLYERANKAIDSAVGAYPLVPAVKKEAIKAKVALKFADDTKGLVTKPEAHLKKIAQWVEEETER